MKTATLTLITLFAAFQAASASEPMSSLIVGGAAAPREEFPYLVSLQTGSFGHFCGGALISSDWVLTAAHCVKNIDLNMLQVVAGLQKLSDQNGVERHEADDIIIHPGYDQATHDYDYALVGLSDESRFPPVILNTSEIDIPDNEADEPMAIIAGWGATTQGGALSQNLLRANVPLVSKPRCNDVYPGKISDRMLCAGFERGGTDTCQGDSGGPLIIRSKRGRPLLAGVVSWGYGCGQAGKYGVYSKVSAAMDWIMSASADPSE